ncbi:MAG: hypothetical protein A3D92_03590 [Bacteroidetes bacterium RIFCSPHIGHO2_02_FULL_44_7]|nr:MAG: hypothetical protein A3D92_03590 [Bacteroidetes bacterium RIFCSPHIGHO2_02_FULL_44_7]
MAAVQIHKVKAGLLSFFRKKSIESNTVLHHDAHGNKEYESQTNKKKFRLQAYGFTSNITKKGI